MEIGAVDNQSINSIQSTFQSKEAPPKKTNSNAFSSSEKGELEEAIVDIISMQAIMKLKELGGMTTEAVTKPSILAKENKEIEQKEQSKREDESNY